MPLAYTDYYKALGVPRDSAHDTKRRAYRKLARKYHPDLNSDSDAEERFKELGEAYEVLSDPDKRERYDRLGARWRDAERLRRASRTSSATRGSQMAPAWSSVMTSSRRCSGHGPLTPADPCVVATARRFSTCRLRTRWLAAGGG